MRLRPDWRLVCRTGGTLTFANEERSVQLVTSADLALELAEHLSGSQVPPVRTEVARALEALNQWGLLTSDKLGIDPRLDRTYEYFSCFDSDPVSALTRLCGSHVLILGLGGTGSVVMQHLIGAGIGALTLVDEDVVEVSNLNRQFVYRLDDVGRAKVDVCAEYARARHPATQCTPFRAPIAGASDLALVIDAETPPDLVLVAIDRPIESIIQVVTAWLAEARIPYVVAGVGVRYGSAATVSVGVADNRNFSGTTASISTTNSISASYAAHSIIEFLTDTPLAFEMTSRA